MLDAIIIILIIIFAFVVILAMSDPDGFMSLYETEGSGGDRIIKAALNAKDKMKQNDEKNKKLDIDIKIEPTKANTCVVNPGKNLFCPEGSIPNQETGCCDLPNANIDMKKLRAKMIKEMMVDIGLDVTIGYISGEIIEKALTKRIDTSLKKLGVYSKKVYKNIKSIPSGLSKGKKMLMDPRKIKAVGKTMRYVVTTIKAAKVAASVAAKNVSMKVAKTAAGRAMKALGKMATKAIATGGASLLLLAVDMASLALDVTDAGGFDSFIDNNKLWTMKHQLDYTWYKYIKENYAKDYLIFPLNLCFEDEYNKFLKDDNELQQSLIELFDGYDEDGYMIYGLKYSELRKRNVKLFEAYEKVIPNMRKQVEDFQLKYSNFESEDINEIIDHIMKIWDIFVGSDYLKKKDNEIKSEIAYHYMKGLLGEKGKYIQAYPELSTDDEWVVSLSKEGVRWWNRERKHTNEFIENGTNRDSWLKYFDFSKPVDPPENYSAPLLAMYVNTHRIVDPKKPGTKQSPNIISKPILDKNGKQVYAPLCHATLNRMVSYCEKNRKGGMKTSTSIDPYEHGVRFNPETGVCKYTKKYCDRLGLDYQRSGVTNCKRSGFMKFQEAVVGTYLARSNARIQKGHVDNITNLKNVDFKGDLKDDFKTLGKAALGAAVLATPGAVVAEVAIKDTMNAIKNTYPRGAGYLPDKCPEGFRKEGTVCKTYCPNGTTRTGEFCTQFIHAYIPGNKSKNPFKKGFYQRKSCRDGYKYRGTTCNKKCRDGFTFRSGAAGSAFCNMKRKTRPLQCKGTDQRNDGLCYKRCRPGYKGQGPTCRKF